MHDPHILPDDPNWPIRAREGRWKRFAILLFMILLGQGIGGWSTMQSVESWYPALTKAPWNPPASVFAPTWTLLYALLLFAGWRVWQKLVALGEPRPWSHPALRAYGWQLAFNFLWSPLFFGLRLPAVALIDLALMLLTGAWMLFAFRRLDKPAFYSQIPYACWISFAFSLNLAIVILN